MDDRRGAGGNIGEGLRKVRPGGLVKFDGQWFHSEQLESLVGQFVLCTATDPFWNRLIVIGRPGPGGGFMFYAREVKAASTPTTS